MMLCAPLVPHIKRFQQSRSVMESTQRPSQPSQQVLLALLRVFGQSDVGAKMEPIRAERQSHASRHQMVAEQRMLENCSAPLRPPGAAGECEESLTERRLNLQAGSVA